MKIQADWLFSDDLQSVLALLNDGDAQTYPVGGCVRNTLMDMPITDIDLASSLDPKIVSNIAENAGFRVLPTGIDHGTLVLVWKVTQSGAILRSTVCI